MSKLEELRAMVADETLTKAARKDAAEYVVRLLTEAVPEPNEDDPEVIDLMKPWLRDTPGNAGIADIFADTTRGRSIHGFSKREALLAIHIRHRRKLLKGLSEDESEPKAIRDAALQLWKRTPIFSIMSANLE